MLQLKFNNWMELNAENGAPVLEFQKYATQI